MNTPMFNEATVRNLTPEEIENNADSIPRHLLAKSLSEMIEGHACMDADELVADYIQLREVKRLTTYDEDSANEILGALTQYIHVYKLGNFQSCIDEKIEAFDKKQCTTFVADLSEITGFDPVYIFDYTADPSDIKELEGFEDAAREWSRENFESVLNTIKKQLTYLTEVVHENEIIKNTVETIEASISNEL